MEGSLAAVGGHSGRGPTVGFARLLLLPHGFPSQVIGDRAGGGLGRFRVLWGLKHCGHERESGVPGKEASPPVSWVCFGESGLVGDGFPRALGTSAGAVTGSGAQAAPVVVVGGHEWAAGGHSCHAFACGLGEASATTPRGTGSAITGGGDQGARPRSPSAQETAGGRYTDKVYHIIM